jgi:heterodisulfide reductase subunit B
MNYGYFPGCSLHSTAKEFSISTEALCKEIDIQLEEVKNWVCCGATPAHTTKEELGIALPYSNILNASEQGFENIVAPCAACYNRLKTADHEVHHSAAIKKRVDEILGAEVKQDVRILHILELLRDEYGYEKLKGFIKKPLKNLKVACYYGCLLVRPDNIVNFDDAEDPVSMDELIGISGATAVEWSHKTECCGASHAIPRTEIVLELCRRILNAAKTAGADCIAVACPLCHVNLDMRQGQINEKYLTEFNTPVLYITQLLALSMGAPYEKLGFASHFVDPLNLFKQKELL